MLSMQQLMARVRTAVNDRDAVTYDEEEILSTLNNGIRYIRRTIADLRPELLASDTITGMLEAGEESVTLSRRPLAFLYVRAGDEVKSSVEVQENQEKIYHNTALIFQNHTRTCSVKTIVKYRMRELPEVSTRDIGGDMEESGTPVVFYRTGEKTIHLYPVPQQQTSYLICPIDDIEEIGEDGKSPLLTEFDDVLVEYAAMRLHVRNEYDVSADASIMSGIYTQIVRLLGEPPASVQVAGYWDSGRQIARDYGRGRW